MDMNAMIGTLESPETLQVQRSVIDLANFYGLPATPAVSSPDLPMLAPPSQNF